MTRTTIHVLIVDDEPGILRMFRRALANYGIAAEGARDTLEARRLLDAGEFDAVITDVNMPGGDGFSLLRELHTIFPALPVIVMTGRPLAGAGEAARRGGAFRYMIKPVMPAALREAIEQAVRLGDLA